MWTNYATVGNADSKFITFFTLKIYLQKIKWIDRLDSSKL